MQDILGTQFHGRLIHRRQLQLFTVSETVYDPGDRLPNHAHDIPYFCFVLKGRFSELRGLTSHECEAATLIFHPAGETHSDYFLVESRCFNIEISDRLADRTAPKGLYLDRCAAVHLALKLYKEFHAVDEASELAIEGLSLEIVAEVTRTVKRRTRSVPGWLSTALEMVHAKFSERFTVSEIAHCVGVHPSHLSREFPRHYGRTIAEHVRHLRIELARDQLCHTSHSISEIATAAGFFDQSHFARTFKNATGLSPIAFRKMFRNR